MIKRNISALTAEIEELASKISYSEADLANATEIRTSEKSAFEATEKELVETQDSLEHALVMLKRSMGFMQTKGHKKAIEQLAASLQTIVEASWISGDEKDKVQKLLQTEDSDEDLTLQPQATTSAYESHGGDGGEPRLRDAQAEHRDGALDDAEAHGRGDERALQHGGDHARGERGARGDEEEQGCRRVLPYGLEDGLRCQGEGVGGEAEVRR